MVLSEGTTEEIPSYTTGIDPGTDRLVAQRLNHYATPGPSPCVTFPKIQSLQLRLRREEAVGWTAELKRLDSSQW